MVEAKRRPPENCIPSSAPRRVCHLSLLAPFQGADSFPLLSGGLRYAATTGYYLAAFQAEGYYTRRASVKAGTSDRHFRQMPRLLHRACSALCGLRLTVVLVDEERDALPRLDAEDEVADGDLLIGLHFAALFAGKFAAGDHRGVATFGN